MDQLEEFLCFKDIIKNKLEIQEAKLRRKLRIEYVLHKLKQCESIKEQSEFILRECVGYAYELQGYDDYCEYLQNTTDNLISKLTSQTNSNIISQLINHLNS